MPVSVVDVGVCATIGDRGEQQDRYIVFEPKQLKSRKELALFAVFDGHGRTQAVELIHNNFVKHLEDQLSLLPDTPTAESYQQVIQGSIKATDVDIAQANLSGGATVALALIDTKQGLFIEADLGDSHVVFANHTAGVEPKKGSWSVKLLSKEHKPDDPEEKKRIEDAGGELNYTSGIARVGGVSMSRALGDVEYKKPKVNRFAGHNFSDVSGMETGVAPGATVIRDLVSNTAHFEARQLQGQSLIMLASDGVGDPQEATENAQLAVAMWQDGGVSLKEIAETLTRRAGTVADADNCTVLLIVLDTEFKGKRKDSGNLEVPKRRGSIGWATGQSKRASRSSFSSIKGSLKDLIG